MHGLQQLETRAPADVIEWRVRRLIAAGFDAGLARALASDCHVDLHTVLELCDRGCPPALAARIVWPL